MLVPISRVREVHRSEMKMDPVGCQVIRYSETDETQSLRSALAQEKAEASAMGIILDHLMALPINVENPA